MRLLRSFLRGLSNDEGQSGSGLRATFKCTGSTAQRGIVALATALRMIGALDRAAYQAIAQTPTPPLDRPMQSLSNAANRSRLWLGIAAAIAVAGGKRGRRAAIESVISLGMASASAHFIAVTTARPRPDRMGLKRFASHEVAMPTSASFPSRHAASGFAFSYAIGRHIPELAVPLRLLASAVAYSRVHIGVHYPGDVVVGSLIGSGIASVVSSAGDSLLAARRQRSRN